ncbi:MAG: helix-turn-helix domain-containing protein [Peptoniphilaceae bacterium]
MKYFKFKKELDKYLIMDSNENLLNYELSSENLLKLLFNNKYKYSENIDGLYISFDKDSNNKKEVEFIKDMIYSEYVYDLIYGNIDRLNVLNDLFTCVGISIKPNIVFSIVYDDFWKICEEKDNFYRYKLKRNLLNYIRKYTKDIKSLSATLIGTDKIILLLDCGNRSKKEAEDYSLQLASKIKNYILKITGNSVSIGLSEYFDNYKNIKKAYEESFRSLDSIFKLGRGKIHKYIKNNGDLYEEFNYEEIIHRLIIQLGLKNSNHVNSIIKSLFDKFLKNNVKEVYIKSNLITILSEISIYFSNLNLENEYKISKDLLEANTKILRANTINDIEKCTSEFLIKLINLFKENKKEDNIDLAVAYMKKYSMLDISLDDISYISGYNKSYFSRIFKEKRNINFSNFLINLRIEESKKLLLNTDLTILEISIKVGFKSLSYFSSTFKKVTGYSPKKYREKNKS